MEEKKKEDLVRDTFKAEGFPPGTVIEVILNGKPVKEVKV